MAEAILWTAVEADPAVAKWAAGEGLDFLSPAERELLVGLRAERRRTEWLLGRWAAKQLLQTGAFAGQAVAFSSISILNERSGAPYALGPDGEAIPGCLSISHSAGTAACAWSGDRRARIGIDIERVEQRDLSFMEDYFTESERTFARALPVEAQETWVTLTWSAKESVLKALKTGLRIDTRRIQVGGVHGLFRRAEGEGEWQALSLRIDEALGNAWQAWWRRRGAFVITLVCLDGDPASQLREV